MDKLILKKFGENVKKLRLSLGISQEELAEKAHLHRTYIGGIERGERNVSLINLVKISSALGIPTYKLLEGIE